MEKFDNKERHRYYGLRIGDLVELNYTQKPEPPKAEVIEYCAGDNNRVLLRLEDGSETDWVAEWCTIITKVEDRKDKL